MDKEQHHDEVQREASVAGMIVGIFILFLLGVAAMALFTLLPAIHISSPAPPPTSLPEGDK
jgi:hypothetical protein